MLPFGSSTVTLVSTVRTSSSVIPIEASLAGSTCTRMAGVCTTQATTDGADHKQAAFFCRCIFDEVVPSSAGIIGVPFPAEKVVAAMPRPLR